MSPCPLRLVAADDSENLDFFLIAILCRTDAYRKISFVVGHQPTGACIICCCTVSILNINILILSCIGLCSETISVFDGNCLERLIFRKLRLHNRYPAFVWSAAEWNNKLLWIELRKPLDGKLIPYNKSHCVDVACPPRKLPDHVRANDSAIECPSQSQTSKLEDSYLQWKLAPDSQKPLA